jgi:hypothetical protein
MSMANTMIRHGVTPGNYSFHSLSTTTGGETLLNARLTGRTQVLEFRP